MSKYQLSLRQKVLMRRDIPASKIVFRVPRGSTPPELDYSVIVKYDLVWWPEPDLLSSGTEPAHQLEAGSRFLTQFETSGTA